jgi:4-hydroxy-tetrahydrodipicolinate synthase
MEVLMTVTASPIPIKTAVNMIGQQVGEPRLPLVSATPEERTKIKNALEDAGVL